jgi:NAD(P)-dependent dehydrogenase (short-subunit alcohol dehydrogenase family)
VASVDVTDEPGQKIAEEVTQKGPGTVTYYHCDISKRVEVDEAFKAAADKLGGLDVFVNVAGVDRKGKAEELSDKDIDLIMDVNVKGTIYTNQAAFTYLHENGGKIINFTSVAGLEGLFAPHYAASKGAVASWTRNVARTWGKHNITVNSIAPMVWTPMYDEHRASMNEEELRIDDENMANSIHIGGKLADPATHLAPVLVFLATEGANYITGQAIPIDGGFYMAR